MTGPAHRRETDRLRALFARGTLLPPVDSGTPSTADLAVVLARTAGHPDPGPPTDAGASLAAEIGPAPHLVFALVDGLGTALLERLPPAAFLRRHLRRELRAIFPSTTATALTTLATGRWPATHAITGWWTHLPDAGLTAAVLPFTERFSGRPLTESGLSAADVFPTPTLIPHYPRRAASILPAAISESVYSRYVRGSTPGRGYGAVAEGGQAALAHVRASAAASYTYLYVSTVDSAAHRTGPDSRDTLAALAEIDAVLARVAAGLPPGGRLVVSADHGLIRVPPERRHVLDWNDPLLGFLAAPPSGEPRVPLFHLRPGADADAFARAFRQRLGEWFLLLRPAEVEAIRLLGPEPLAPRTRARLGDFLAIAPGPDVLFSRTHGVEGVERLTGYHGGLSPAEMRAPLIVAGG